MDVVSLRDDVLADLTHAAEKMLRDVEWIAKRDVVLRARADDLQAAVDAWHQTLTDDESNV